MSNRTKELWKQDWYRNKLLKLYSTKEYKASRSKSSLEVWGREGMKEKQSLKKKQDWETPEYRELMSSITSSEEYKQIHRENTTELWKDQEYRDKIHNEENHKKLSDSITQLWENEEYRNKVTKAQNDPKVQDQRLETRTQTMRRKGFVNYGKPIIVTHLESGSILEFKKTEDCNKWIELQKPGKRFLKGSGLTANAILMIENKKIINGHKLEYKQ